MPQAVGITIDLASQRPVYQQIADEIRRLSAQGRLSDGQDLPSVRQLADRAGVNLNTVAKAYRVLAEEGLVELRHGSGATLRLPGLKRGASLLDDDSERRIDAVLARWVLAGATQADVESALRRAVDRYFAAQPPER